MSSRSVLLVEDNEDNADDAAFAMLAFKDGNFDNDIVLARDGPSALEMLLPAAGTTTLVPGVVLLDINMPKMGGFDVLRRIRADPSTCLLPVVMLTTSDLSDDIRQSYRLGVNGYICKSISFGAFQETIGAFGAFWLRVNQVPTPYGDDPERQS